MSEHQELTPEENKLIRFLRPAVTKIQLNEIPNGQKGITYQEITDIVSHLKQEPHLDLGFEEQYKRHLAAYLRGEKITG